MEHKKYLFKAGQTTSSLNEVSTEQENDLKAYSRSSIDDEAIRLLFSERLPVPHKAKIWKVPSGIAYLIADVFLLATAVLLGFSLWQLH
jgi:hypothetical protein